MTTLDALTCRCGHGWEHHGHDGGGCIECSCAEPNCDHPGRHCRALSCPDCGQFSAHSWTTKPMYTPDGYYERWGGTCRFHGEWSDSA